ncbi:FadR/GntR family transcriptional regulator [Gracilibacillus salinarum]|uniref:GntR family transcriptional regulator n=1 Tax=Gracilibacillus salinarum TaxID=2932255 RepID=A0ABY4GPK6_9BACI|nr:GntR family transcriptional regulator [Gracilibacillus salinarum]UOQ86277.1 GntR family transcriptional regulator [Gracilibacillus salinarum]
MSERTKVYQQVLTEIQRLIKEDGYLPGDKLPSERQLSVQLNAARSSVREALRAIELLGIIDTRQGEGTYLRNYQTYQAVGLLASFVLQDSKTQSELAEAKQVLEDHVISSMTATDQQIEQLTEIINDQALTDEEKHHRFFSVFFEAYGNQLLLKIWRLMEDFSLDNKSGVQLGPYYKSIMKHIQDNR